MCCASFQLFTGSGYSSPTGLVLITGLPFTKKVGSKRSYGVIGYHGYASSTLSNIRFRLEANNTTGTIMDGGETSYISATQLETSETYVTFTYETE